MHPCQRRGMSVPDSGITRQPAGIRIAGDTLVLHLMSGSGLEVRAVLYGDSINGTVLLPDGHHRVRLARAGTALAESIRSGIGAAVGALRARPLELVEPGLAWTESTGGRLTSSWQQHTPPTPTHW
jgi:hypothetical protein